MARAWSGDGGGLSRREVLRRLGLAGGALAVAPSVLAACGGDNSGSGQASGTTAAGGGASASSSGGGGTGDAGAQLKTILGLKDTDKLGGDLNWKMGAVLALTGNGSYYGKTMSNGINLAVKHIKAAGARRSTSSTRTTNPATRRPVSTP